jgi:hypothetical protein
MPTPGGGRCRTDEAGQPNRSEMAIGDGSAPASRAAVASLDGLKPGPSAMIRPPAELEGHYKSARVVAKLQRSVGKDQRTNSLIFAKARNFA